MKTCPLCGFHHSDKDTRCVRCQAQLDPEGKPDVEDFLASRVTASGSPLVYGGSGLAFLTRPLVLLLHRLAGAVVVPLPDDLSYRNPWKSGFLSLIPGLGQLYNHQPKKAAFILIGWTVSLTAALATFYKPYNTRICFLVLLWMTFSFYDGFKTASRINGRIWRFRTSLGAYVAFVFEMGLIFILASAVSSALFVKFRYISESILEPVFQMGDRIAVDVFTYKFRDPRVGDIVFYDPKKITMGIGNKVVVDAVNGFERVVAGPGETFERREGIYYRNGVEVSAEEGPLLPGEVPRDFRFVAPEDHYIVIMTSVPYEKIGSAHLQPPSLRSTRNLVGWEEACVVPRGDIHGRCWFIYHPPPRRRFLKRAAR